MSFYIRLTPLETELAPKNVGTNIVMGPFNHIKIGSDVKVIFDSFDFCILYKHRDYSAWTINIPSFRNLLEAPEFFELLEEEGDLFYRIEIISEIEEIVGDLAFDKYPDDYFLNF